MRGRCARSRQTSPTGTVFLEAGEKIKTVEANALHGCLPVEAEGSFLVLDSPAELPMRPDYE
jgi:hypothetical protein